ncbi:MAG: hypothetical protein HQL20_02255 [Candidatus Omnitrophica bacterium]|nr:hypothetical protein [Candidatus Omnitrophota bacterium]
MSLQTVKTEWLDRRFGAALLLAGLLHVLLFSNVAFTLNGAPRQYRIDTTFWGSILRKQDLQPQMLVSSREVGKTLVLEPSKLAGSFQSLLWQLGVMVDKPVVSQSTGAETLPLKFLTERVEVDEVVPDAVPGIPEAPLIRLKGPRK